MRARFPLILLLSAVLALHCAVAQSAQSVAPAQLSDSGKYLATSQSAEGRSSQASRLTLQKVEEHRFLIETVSVDTLARTISFPVTLEQDSSNLEYALVGNKGKVHESLLVTDVLPAQVHYAAMLLGVKKGDAVRIKLEWGVPGLKQSKKLAEVIKVELPNKPDGVGKWIYTGHTHTKGWLNAQPEESLIALINDPSALINTTLSEQVHSDDIYLLTSPYDLPKKGLPISLILEFGE